MNNQHIVITGASGVVGSVLVNGLPKEYTLHTLDYAECDLTKLSQVAEAIPDGTDQIIHLAWKNAPIYKDGIVDADNIAMALHVLETAVQKKIRRVILASSVHVQEYHNRTAPISVRDLPQPDSIYGATKIYIEALGNYYAHYHQLEVIVVRLGGVNKEDVTEYNNEPDYAKIYLSHADLITTISKILVAPITPGQLQIQYAVSANKNAVHRPSEIVRV